MLSFIKRFGLYIIIIILSVTLLIKSDILFYSYSKMTVSIGIKNDSLKQQLLSASESIKKTKEALDDSELQEIISDAKKRGILED